ncbi:MAG TPA: DNA-deoxyinosine glycosylase, partial [Lachnoclostridium phytofermentans]|nr:DNA-deoxyinosine glycosylase [Lachnoclostridium phytofermentans]
MGDYQHVSHTFEPVFDKNSKILILGSFPSVKSREQEFYYGHPMNRFWRMLSTVLEKEIPSDSSKKREFLLENHIALWDVIDSCDIIGSSDSSIKNVIPTDLSRILA